ncbi:hypothetical protein SEPCBS119000_006419 [Sporothrix epigloea]|uniref:AB hydrolase-1 domain-containing protein n=1 Tax=Sporothrix epigloea TaxID=1892477 RepID=A0ABP0E4V2_9PEZI
MAEIQHLTLLNGRTLAYRIYGASSGFPLVWFHGTPAGIAPPPLLVKAAGERGIKIIAAARPGFGGSARHHGRRVVDAVADIQVLNEHLGVKECLVAGWSGGGPHTLACAARLPGVIAALTIAGVGPADAPDLDFLAGQGEDNVAEFQAAQQGEDALRAFCLAQLAEIVQGSVADAVAALRGILSAVDYQACLESAELGEYLVSLLRDGMSAGVDGWIDDDLELTQPWGFGLSEVCVPVLLYQGSDDIMVPYSHGVWLAQHLPKEHLREHLIEGEGHVSLVAKGDELLEELIKAGGISRRTTSSTCTVPSNQQALEP